ncbi:MAG: hypothetical protein EXR79_13060 [Myxococcales bacterium]|nr:hypothetical protein [Myxococcales bacterium]
MNDATPWAAWALAGVAAGFAAAGGLPDAWADVGNPSVEVADALNSTQPAQWTTDSWGGVIASFGWVTPAKDGLKALRVEVKVSAPDGDAKWWSAPFAVEPGTTKYRVSDWYRASVPSTLMLVVQGAGVEKEYYAVANLPAAATWTYAKGDVALPPWVTTLRLLHVISQVGWLETDLYAAARKTEGGSGRFGSHPALVSVTFDDGWVSAYGLLVPKLQAMGWRGTHYIISGFMNRPGFSSDYMTNSQIEALIDGGHEIGSHTVTHDDLTQQGPADVETALVQSRAQLEAIGAAVSGFAPPYGHYTAAVRQKALTTYSSFRTVKPGIEQWPYETGELRCIDVLYDMPLATVEEYLVEAEEAPSGWLLLLFHRASSNDTHTAPTYVTPQKFQQVLDLLQAHKAIVKPVGEVLGTWKPSVPKAVVGLDAGKSLGAPDVWDRATVAVEPVDGAASSCSAGARPSPAAAVLVLLGFGVWLARRRRALAEVAVGLALLGCGVTEPAASKNVFRLGGLDVRVTENPARLQVMRSNGDLLFDGVAAPHDATPTDAARATLAFRRQDVNWKMSFGAYKRDVKDDLPWTDVAGFGSVRVAGGVLAAVGLDRAGQPLADIEMRSPAAGELQMRILPRAATWNRTSIGFACRSDEHFQGLGGQSWDVDHRGQTVPLWVEEDGISKHPTDAQRDDWAIVGRRHSTHSPMPIFVSSRGYGVLLDTPDRATFALCSERADTVRIENEGAGLTLHIFEGPQPLDVVRRLTARTGRPPVPPAFAFAPWHDAVFGSANVRRVAEKLRAEHVPSSAIWTEDWRGNNGAAADFGLEEDWNVDRKVYPDFELVAADLHGLGFKFLTYNNTFLVNSADVHADAVAGGHTMKTADGKTATFAGTTLKPTTLLDVSSPTAVAWAKGVMRKGLEQGADGWMADFCEWLPTDCVVASGSCLHAHNPYPADYARLNRELLDEQQKKDGIERIFFMRAAWLGSQPHIHVFWPGDQQTDWSEGDGMPSVVPMGIGLGLTGFPYFGPDIAGYISVFTDASTEELWFRWVELGALSPVMRTHHGRSISENWNWEKDAKSIGHFRRYGALHTRLYPYFAGLARRASESGAPLFGPLSVRWPDFGPAWTRTDQYLLGDRIVVAPVLTPKTTKRSVWLPVGRYARLPGTGPQAWTEVIGAAVPVEVAAEMDEVPALVPAGSVLVLLPEGVETLFEAQADKGIKGLAWAGEDREVWLFGGGDVKGSTWAEAAPKRTYTWQPNGWSAGPAASAQWNGKPATRDSDGAWHVVGAGTLRLDSKAALVVVGGAAGAKLRVRVW